MCIQWRGKGLCGNGQCARERESVCVCVYREKRSSAQTDHLVLLGSLQHRDLHLAVGHGPARLDLGLLQLLLGLFQLVCELRWVKSVEISVSVHVFVWVGACVK